MWMLITAHGFKLFFTNDRTLSLLALNHEYNSYNCYLVTKSRRDNSRACIFNAFCLFQELRMCITSIAQDFNYTIWVLFLEQTRHNVVDKRGIMLK